MPVSSRFYLYKDIDMTEILEARLAEEGLDNGSISVLGAMSNLKKGELTYFVKENRKMYPEPTTLLIPYNLGNAHWVGILLEYDENGKPKRAEYMDSIMGREPSESIKKEIRNIDPQFELKARKVSWQYDFTSCGAYAIENLLSAATNIPSRFSGGTMEIRKKHAICQEQRAERLQPRRPQTPSV